MKETERDKRRKIVKFDYFAAFFLRLFFKAFLPEDQHMLSISFAGQGIVSVFKEHIVVRRSFVALVILGLGADFFNFLFGYRIAGKDRVGYGGAGERKGGHDHA